MFDTEKLILEVRNYPCIWNMTSNEYSNKELKKTCWRKVTECMYAEEWLNFSEAEKESKVKEVKDKKWRHIRDAYMKHLSEEKNIKSGSEANKKKPYSYAESLSFLNTAAQKRKTTGNFEIEENNESHDESLNENEDICTETESPVNVSFSKTSLIHNKKKKNSLNPSQQNLLQNLNEDNNPDKNLVLSFLPYIKRLNDDEKLDFQIHTLHHLKNVIKKQNTPYQFTQNRLGQHPIETDNSCQMSTSNLPVNYPTPLPNYVPQSVQLRHLLYPEYTINFNQTPPTYIYPPPSDNSQTN